jgi:hypothetical protein
MADFSRRAAAQGGHLKERMVDMIGRYARVSVFAFLTGLASMSTAHVTVPPQQGGAVGTGKLTPACVAARSYFELGTQHRFTEMGALFAEKVDYIGPDGIARSSGADVAKIYAGMKDTHFRQLVQSDIFRLVPIGDNECFLEFAVSPSDGNTLFAVDHFIVDGQGKVIWFRPFFQQAFRGN